MTQDGQTLLADNPDSNTLSILDTSSLEKLAEIPVGIDPRGVTLTFDDTLAFVANQGSNSLSVVNLADQTTQATVPVGDRPVNVALSPEGRFLAVAYLGEEPPGEQEWKARGDAFTRELSERKKNGMIDAFLAERRKETRVETNARALQ